MLVTGLIALIAVLSGSALVVALRAYQLAADAKLVPSTVRELIRETEDVLEKLAQRQARESMRVLRTVRRKAEEPPQEEATEPEAAPQHQQGEPDVKAALWAIVRQRGMAR